MKIPAAFAPQIKIQIGAGEMEKEQDPRMQTVAYVVATFIAVCAVAILAAGTVKLIMWMF